MTQLFFRKPLQSHRQYQWLHKKCGKPCGTVATTYYFSPLLLAKLATQNEAVTFSSIANIFNHLANRNLFTMCEKKKKRIKRLSHGQGAPNEQHHCPHLWFVPASFFTIRPHPHVSGDFCIRHFLFADTPSVHTCPPYTLGVSRDFCIRSPEWKFLYTLCIRIRVDARIRRFLYTLTSQYQNQSFSGRDFPCSVD